MFQKLIELLERFVVAYEKDVEYSTNPKISAFIGVGDSAEKLVEVVNELVAPDDSDVLKADLRAGRVDYKDGAKTPTLQKLWLEMQSKGAPADAPARKYTAEEVRAKAIERSGAVGKEKVQEVFKQFGATKFTEIPEGRYSEVMAVLEGLK